MFILGFAKCREGGHGVSALGRGVQGLLGGVTAGVTGVVRAPLQGYNDGSGVVTGNSCIRLLLLQRDELQLVAASQLHS